MKTDYTTWKSDLSIELLAPEKSFSSNSIFKYIFSINNIQPFLLLCCMQYCEP